MYGPDSLPLVAAFAREWAADCRAVLDASGRSFDSESRSVLAERAASADALAVRFSAPDAAAHLRLPRRDFTDHLPQTAWEAAIARGIGSAIEGTLRYVRSRYDFNGG